jgi:hypothetical protein
MCSGPQWGCSRSEPPRVMDSRDEPFTGLEHAAGDTLRLKCDFKGRGHNHLPGGMWPATPPCHSLSHQPLVCWTVAGLGAYPHVRSRPRLSDMCVHTCTHTHQAPQQALPQAQLPWVCVHGRCHALAAAAPLLSWVSLFGRHLLC